MAYTTIDKPTDYFETILYSGNGSTLNVGGLDFTQDFTWIKNRVDSTSHFLYDTVRGAGNDKDLRSNSNGAEGSGDGATHGFMSAFRSDGFTVNQGSSTASITNASGNSYTSWNWRANGSGSANTDGSISSTVSANTTAGFSIVKYTGTGSTATIGHGLGVSLSMIILKSLDRADNWWIYHKGLSNPSNKAILLNLTNAEFTPGTSAFNTSTFSSSVFGILTDRASNASGEDYIAYCFAEKKGYSKFGSYTGNANNDGTFVYLGFKPSIVICKKSSSTGDWELYDNKRNGYNGGNVRVHPSANDAETGTGRLSLLSNGFKITTSSGNLNGSGNSFIYMAFAESPFVTSTGIPTTAR